MWKLRHRQVKQCAQASHGKALIWTLGPDSFFPLWARLHGEEGREVGGVCSVRRVTLLTIAGVFLEPKAGVAAGLLHSLEQEAERHKSWSDLPYPALFCFSPCLLPSYLSQQHHSLYTHISIFLPFKHQLRPAMGAVFQSRGRKSDWCTPIQSTWGGVTEH